MRVLTFDSWLPSLTFCYAGVIQETCNTSAADINVLKTIIYNGKLSGNVYNSCPLGELNYDLFGSTARCITTRDVHGNGKDWDPMGPMGFPWEWE